METLGVVGIWLVIILLAGLFLKGAEMVQAWRAGARRSRAPGVLPAPPSESTQSPVEPPGPLEAADRRAARMLTLRSEHDERGVHSLSLCFEENGDVKIEGQDLGPGVAEWFGEGRTEYEWTITISATDVPAYVRGLGGNPGDNIPELVRTCYNRDPHCVSTRFLQEHGIPNDLWSRVGD
jgi:hypothetical protein